MNSSIRLVVGLGNPGSKYENTRHNIGFMVARKLLAMVAADGVKTKFEGEIAEGSVGSTKTLVLCPTTYMNSSGKSVRKALDFYKLSPSDVLVICDDMNLTLGQLRIRGKGSSGGQKGLGDIIRLLGTEDVPRLRVGIDPPPPGWIVTDYVLSKFKRSEEDTVANAVENAAHAAVDWVTHGIDHCMNHFNTKKNKT